jgi:hypothetical protein
MKTHDARARFVTAMALVLAALVAGSALAGGKKTDWYLIDGTLAGQRIVATEESAPAPVLPVDNPGGSAEGQIAPADVGCQPPPVGTHFHGSLFSNADPDPTGCGWGRAVTHGSRTDALRDLSKAIEEELDAFLLLVLVIGDPGDIGARQLAAASRALTAAERELERLLERGRIGADEASEVQAELSLARSLDEGVEAALDAGDAEAAVDLLRDAIEAKRRAFRRLAAALL